jgi:hypothetical protein
MLERSLILFGSYAFQAAGAIVLLLVFLALKRELYVLRTRVTRLDFSLRLDAMNDRLREAEERALSPAAPVVARRSVNLSKRSQVIRLSRRGEPVETIAATLNLPRREVELLLKVHQVSAASAGAPTS